MAVFGSIAPGADWQDEEARANLAAIEAAKPKPAWSWMDVLRTPNRIVGGLAATPVENADAGAMMPETYVNPMVKGAMDAAGHAVASGATAPGEALAGKIPAFDAEGHTSPEMISRGFDTAALAGGGSAAANLGRDVVSPGTDLRVLGKQILASDTAKPGAGIAAAEKVAAPIRAYKSMIGDTPNMQAETGLTHVALDRLGAERFAAHNKPVREVSVAVDNPFDFRNQAHRDWLIDEMRKPENVAAFNRDTKKIMGPGYDFHHDAGNIAAGIEDGAYQTLETPAVSNLIKRRGHDGIYMREDFQRGEPNLALFDPSKISIIRSDSAPSAAIAAAEHAPAFHLTAEEALANTARKSGTGAQWANELKRYGAKPEELDWRGATDLLTKNANVPITRATVEQHLAGNPFEIKTVDKGSLPTWENLPAEEKAAVEQQWHKEREGQPSTEDAQWYATKWPDPEALYADMVDNGYQPKGSFTKYEEYQLPGGENYRERLLTLPQKVSPEDIIKRDGRLHVGNKDEVSPSYLGPHWDEPNILVHRRSTDRLFPEPYTAEEQAAIDARQRARGDLNGNRQQQNMVARKIRDTSEQFEQSRRDQLARDYNDGKITQAEFRRGFDEYVEHPGLRPLQDRLQELRAQEDAIRKGMPAEIAPKGIRSLHAEEIQSDWHQTGQKHGYKGNPDTSGWTAKEGAGDPASGPTWEVRDRNGRWILGVPRENGMTADQAIRRAANSERGPDFNRVPNAPFKDSWHQLAAHDMLREAAEGGYPRISWTAGEAAPTNPKNLNVGGGAPNAERTAAYEKADKGLQQFYNEKLVNTFNKIGKQHGVEVKETALGQPRYRMIDDQGKPGSSFDTMEELKAHLAKNPEGAKFWPGVKEEPAPRGFYMDVPQSLRDQALKKGFSLFEDAGPAGAAVASAAHMGERNVGQITAGDVGRGAAGGDAGLAEAARAAARRAGTAQPLPGLPSKAMKIGDEYFVPGPIGSIRDVADRYMKTRDPAQHSMKFPERYHEIDPARAQQIAKAFDEMPHAPDDPRVKASYDAMIKETRDQYDHLMKTGLKVSPIGKDMADPYALNPRLAAKDAADNNHLWFFPTESGFGTTAEGIDMAKHPLMQPSGRELNGRPLLNNDLFRIVHDYFGHFKEGYGFRGAGEDNAYRSHAAMYSDLARPAMTTETRGQNSWVNYGPHGETNRKASAADTHYAEQKVGLLPDWVMGEGYPGKVDWQDALRGVAFEPASPAIAKTKLTDEQGLPIQGAAYTKEARKVLDDIAKGEKGAGPMDLSTQGQVPDVPQTPLERYVPPRGVSERMVDALSNPDVTKGIGGSIKKGMPVADWYHTEPVRRAFFGELGPVKGQQEFNRYMDTVAATSPRSDVPTNIRNASYYYGVGSPENLPPKNPYPFGHVAQNLHRQNFETISRNAGWDVMQNPKPASFAANLKGNLSPVTVDTHAFRNIAMRTNDPRFLETSFSQIYKPGVNRAEDSMVKKYGEVRGNTVTFRPQKLYKEGKLTLEEARDIPSFWATKPKDNEYAAAENLYRDLAKKAKISPADAQAAAWAGAGDLTGLGTVGTHTFPELMNERVLFTSRMRGESPQKTLSDFIRGKRPLLSDTSVGMFGSLAPNQDAR